MQRLPAPFQPAQPNARSLRASRPSCSSNACHPRCVVVVPASSTDAATPGHARRSAGRFLATAAASLQLLTLPANAMWDGVSSAMGSCPLGDDGIECRKTLLAKDGLGSYSNASNNAAKVNSGPAGGVPVSEMGDAYVKETLSLADDILQYATMDVYDDNRVGLVKRLKPEGQAWVSRYARGGSARKLSARQFYIAVDALEGHLASNGFAPFPKNKMPKLIQSVEDAKALIAEGK